MRKPGYSAALSCVLVRAESAARELGSGVTGTEHLLLALAQEKISSAGKILICQCVDCGTCAAECPNDAISEG